MLAQLGSRLTFLTSGPRDAPARQQTLRATIEWSYALSGRARAGTVSRAGGLCWRLYAFERSGGVQHGERTPGDVAARVEVLVDKSMVRADLSHEEPHFFMFETLREYALERLVESGEAEAVRRQHAQFFLALAEEAEPQLFFTLRAHWLERLEREHDNLRAALRWFIDQRAVEVGLRLGSALCSFWEARGYLTEGRKWITDLLALAATEPRTAARAKALLGAGNLAYAQGDHVSAETLVTESMAIGREVGDWESIAWSQYRLGDHQLGCVDRITRRSPTWRRAWHSSGRSAISAAPHGRSQFRVFTGISMGDTAAARPLLEESVAIGRKVGDTCGHSLCTPFARTSRRAPRRSDNRTRL